MSDIWNEIDNETPTEGSKLRELYENALRDLKSVKKELDGYKAQESATVIGDFLKGKGFKPSAAKWAVKDGIKPNDTDALEQWIKDNSDDLPRLPESDPDETSEPGQEPAPEEPQADPAAAGYADIVSQLRSNASPATADKFEQATREIPENATPEQVIAAFTRAGV